MLVCHLQRILTSQKENSFIFNIIYITELLYIYKTKTIFHFDYVQW